MKDFILFEDDNIQLALKKIEKNRCRMVFIVNHKFQLTGCLSEGDFRRYLIETDDLSLDKNVSAIMNTDVFYLDQNSNEKKDILLDKYKVVPIVDVMQRIVDVIFDTDNIFKIGEKMISDTNPSYIIAEIGNNHNGNLDIGKRLIDAAADAGVDCVKFQYRNLNSLYGASVSKDDHDLSVQYTFDLLKKFNLKLDELKILFEYADTQNLQVICTPWDITSAKSLTELDLVAYKVASADFTNLPLLSLLAKSKRPLICSTGMTTDQEIEKVISHLKDIEAKFILLHCNSTYPTPYKDVNLKFINKLKDMTGSIVGYSGHERGFEVPIAAVAMGAKIVEKHLTLNRDMEGADHKVSLLPNEFKKLVSSIRNVEAAIGSSDNRRITQGELINRQNLAKSLVARQNIKKGQLIKSEYLDVKAPGQGLQPLYAKQLIGLKANRNLKKNDLFYSTDLESAKETLKNHKFNNTVGIPVRFHDFYNLVDGASLDFVEFHFSYNDLNVEISDYFKSKNTKLNFSVHCPELFENDHVLDLCSLDDTYIKKSIDNVKRTIEKTRKLSAFFQSFDKIPMVLNAGGWTRDKFDNKTTKSLKYEKLSRSIEILKSFDNEIEFSLQTMPPFPWHFGGQSFHNIFVLPDEIEKFSKQNDVSVCLDISHSQMACTYFNLNFKNFLEKVLPVTNYLHIVDALGVDGEGVEIGKGDVNFDCLIELINKTGRQFPFIPEVWQGHTNNGTGFWSALEFLSKRGL